MTQAQYAIHGTIYVTNSFCPMGEPRMLNHSSRVQFVDKVHTSDIILPVNVISYLTLKN